MKFFVERQPFPVGSPRYYVGHDEKEGLNYICETAGKEDAEWLAQILNAHEEFMRLGNLIVACYEMSDFPSVQSTPFVNQLAKLMESINE